MNKQLEKLYVQLYSMRDKHIIEEGNLLRKIKQLEKELEKDE